MTRGIALLTALAIGGFAIGCQSTPSDTNSNTSKSQDSNAGQAGGNGAFGENPAHPGYGEADRPTTQPASNSQ